ADGRYSETAQLLERAVLHYDSPQIRLLLSEAYLARRDAVRAERQVRIALDSAPPDLQPAAWAQLGRVLTYAGRPDEAQAAWNNVPTSAAPFRGVGPIEAQVRSATWHTAMRNWSDSSFDAARTRLQSLLNGDDIYAVSARTKLAQLYAPASSDISRQHLQAAQRATAHAKSDAAVPNL